LERNPIGLKEKPSWPKPKATRLIPFPGNYKGWLALTFKVGKPSLKPEVGKPLGRKVAKPKEVPPSPEPGFNPKNHQANLNGLKPSVIKKGMVIWV